MLSKVGIPILYSFNIIVISRLIYSYYTQPEKMKYNSTKYVKYLH